MITQTSEHLIVFQLNLSCLEFFLCSICSVGQTLSVINVSSYILKQSV